MQERRSEANPAGRKSIVTVEPNRFVEDRFGDGRMIVEDHLEIEKR
jgi:hypothetical protein